MKVPWVLIFLCLGSQIVIVSTNYGPEHQHGTVPIQEVWVDYEPLCFQDENQTIHLYLDFGYNYGSRGPQSTQAFLYWDDHGDWMNYNFTRWTYRRELTRIYEDLPLGHQHFMTHLPWDFYGAHWEPFYNEWNEAFGGSRTWFYLNITTPSGWRTAGWFYPFYYDNIVAERNEFELPPWAYTDPMGNIITKQEVPCGWVEDDVSAFPTGRELLSTILQKRDFQLAMVLFIVGIPLLRWALKDDKKEEREQE